MLDFARISLLPGGTAGNNDRGPVDQTMIFPANVKVKFVTITINDDKLVENVEFFRIKITGKSPAVFPTKFKNTKVIIVDNDVGKNKAFTYYFNINIQFENFSSNPASK